jgi:hypothetical protein
MRLLPDTRVVPWWRADERRLAEPARSAIATLEIPDSFEAGVVDSGFEKLPVGFSHAETAARLPPQHPRDPFDRMLVPALAGLRYTASHCNARPPPESLQTATAHTSHLTKWCAKIFSKANRTPFVIDLTHCRRFFSI